MNQPPESVITKIEAAGYRVQAWRGGPRSWECDAIHVTQIGNFIIRATAGGYSVYREIEYVTA